MNITYDWKITALKKAPSLDDLSDVITHINFNYTGADSDSGESHTFNGACPVGAPSGDSFTVLADLTEEDIISWAQANHPVDHMNEVIEKAISGKVTPVNMNVTELEWLNLSNQDEHELTEETTIDDV